MFVLGLGRCATRVAVPLPVVVAISVLALSSSSWPTSNPQELSNHQSRGDLEAGRLVLPAARPFVASTQSARQEALGPVGGVSQTLDLANGSLHPGSYVPVSCLTFSGVAVAPSLHRVFVTCTATGALVAFDETTGVEVGAVQVGPSPIGVTFDPDDGRLYIAASDGVAVVDATNSTLVGTVPLPFYPTFIAYDNESRCIYVSDYDTGNVSVISTTNDSLLTNVPLGGAAGPEGIVYDTVDQDVYVAGSLGFVGVISASNNSLVTKIPVNGEPWALTYNPLTGEVYVLAQTGFDLVVISSITQQPVASLGLGLPTEAVAYDSKTNLIYVSTFLTQCNVTSINASNLAIVGNVRVHPDAEALAIDDSVDRLFVADTMSSDLAVINLSGLTVVAYYRSDPSPNSVAWDSISQSVYVTNQVYGTVDEISSRTNEILSSNYLGQGLAGLASDTSTGDLFVGNPNNGRVYQINSTGVLQQYSSTGGDVSSVAYDSDNGFVYAASDQANFVSVLNGSTDALVQDIGIQPYGGIGGGLTGIAFDPRNGNLYVSVEGCICGPAPGNVTVIDGATDRIMASIAYWGNPGPSSVAVDTQNNELYVTDNFANLLWAFNLSTNSLISVTPVGSAPDGIAIDSPAGYVYVSNSGSNNVTVVDTVTNRVLGSISVGLTPLGVAFDPANGNVYVANQGSGTLSIIHRNVYPVTFNETGLPAGTHWNTTLGGVSNSSTTSVIGFSEPNGTYPYSIAGISGWHPVTFPRVGSMTVDGSAIDEFVNWTATTYSVTFTEKGLAANITWNVTLGGVSRSTNTSAVTFAVANGSYTFSVGVPKGYAVQPLNGSLKVNGTTVGESVAFTKTPGPTLMGILAGEGYSLLIGIAAAAAVMTALLAIRSRRRKPKSANSLETSAHTSEPRPPT